MDPIIKKILNFKKEDISKYEPYLMLGGGTPGVNLIRGKNIYVYDIEGSKYLDCTSQSWALHLGYNHPEINAVVREQMEYTTHFHTGFFTIPRYILAKNPKSPSQKTAPSVSKNADGKPLFPNFLSTF